MPPTVKPGSPSAPQSTERPISSAYSAYITFVLAMVFMLAATDRNIMSILLVSIQSEIGASDTAMGVLSGAAFSIVYGVSALPLALLADRGNRRNLVAVAVTGWSAMTAACGLAAGYFTLLLARTGVALGEAAHQPAIMSMVADLYPRHRRGTVVACITIGSAVGIGLGAYLAGLFNDMYGWRVAFLAMGVPGLVVAALLMFTLPEPIRGRFEGGARIDPDGGSLRRGLVYLAKVPTIPRLLMAKVLLQIGFQGFLTWVPAFFIRVYGMTTAEMSAGFGAAVGAGSILSMVLAGLVSDHLSKRGERWRAYYCSVALIAAVIPILAVLFASSAQVALGALFFMALTAGGVVASSLTAGLGVVRPTMRGLMTAAMNFASTGLGAALGPVLFGALNDNLKETYGNEAIRFALAGVPATFILAAIMFYAAGRTTDEDCRRAQTYPDQPATGHLS